MTSHRVQVEARRASNMHSERTKERRKTSDQRLAERLAARNKVKSSRCLQKSPAFASLDETSVAEIVDVMEYTTAKPREVLCKEGDPADKIFVIVSGACDVSITGSHVALLHEMDVFGESALFPDATGASVRSATVTATAATVSLLVLKKSELDALVEREVLDHRCIQALAKVAERRRQQNMQLLDRAKQAHVLQRCTAFAGLPQETQDRIIGIMTYQTFSSGAVVCRQGDPADCMYLIMRGVCTVCVEKEQTQIVVGSLCKFDIFGESALFVAKRAVRTATVTATEMVETLVLSRRSMRGLIQNGGFSKEWGRGLKKMVQQRRRGNAAAVEAALRE